MTEIEARRRTSYRFPEVSQQGLEGGRHRVLLDGGLEGGRHRVLLEGGIGSCWREASGPAGGREALGPAGGTPREVSGLEGGRL